MTKSVIKPLVITYRNYNGIISMRRIIPITTYFGCTKWHPEPQWMMRAFDLDKQAERDFALKDFNHHFPTFEENEPDDSLPELADLSHQDEPERKQSLPVPLPVPIGPGGYFTYSKNIFGNWSPMLCIDYPEEKLADGRVVKFAFTPVNVPLGVSIEECMNHYPAPKKED